MNEMVSRRELLQRFGAAGAGVCLGAQTEMARRLGASLDGDTALTVAGRRVEMSITVVSPRALRLSLLAIGDDGRAQALGDSLALAQQNWPAPIATIRSISGPQIIPSGTLRVKVSAQPLIVRVEQENGREVQQVQVNTENGSLGFSLGDGPIFGLGEGGRQFDRRGTSHPMRSGSGVPDLRTNGARVPIPWLMGAAGWALFVHQPIGGFDLTASEGRFEPWTSEPAIPLDLFVVATDQPARIFEEYARLTGFPHMPPIWALGYQQSHRTLVSEEEVLGEAKAFRQKKLPCDVLIYLGTGFCPSGWNTGNLGPPELEGYGRNAGVPDTQELLNPEVEPICRKYLELRYRLMPYLYTAIREAHDTGLPIMRALWVHYPDDARAVERGDEYLWGRDVLVAPVTEKGATSRLLYLPRGVWYDFWTQEKVQGGREITRPVDLATLPLYVRAGAIVPMGPVQQYVGETKGGPLTVMVYPGADGRSFVYHDDGVTFNYQKGEFMRLRLDWNDPAERLVLSLEPGSKMLPPLPGKIEIRIASTGLTRSVVFTGEAMDVTF